MTREERTARGHAALVEAARLMVPNALVRLGEAQTRFALAARQGTAEEQRYARQEAMDAWKEYRLLRQFSETGKGPQPCR